MPMISDEQAARWKLLPHDGGMREQISDLAADLLDARRERDEARKALRERDALLGGLLGIIERDRERVTATLDFLRLEDEDALKDAAQSAIGGAP